MSNNTDLDQILDSLPDHQTEDVPLQDIMAIPGIGADTVLPYHMYLTYNPRLPEDRKEKIREIINRIKFNTDYVNKNINVILRKKNKSDSTINE